VNREELRSNIRLQTLIEDTNVTDTSINALINQGISEIAVQFTWPWLEETATISLAANTRTAALPGDYLFGAVLIDDDKDTELPFISSLEFFRRVGNDTGNTSANPDFYTIFEGSIYFSPIPSANDTNRYTFYYYETPTTLSADGNSPAFNAAFHWVLVEYAKWKLYEREEYYDQSERARISYVSYLNDMIAWYGRSVQRAWRI
jgi:hypothetical protein